MAGSFLLVLIYLLMPIKQTSWFYILVAGLGFFSGYWALFITVAAELFGSNIRATVATTVPNFVRGTVIPLTALFVLMKSHVGTLYGALVVGAITYLIAMFALFVLEETFKKDIIYTEDV